MKFPPANFLTGNIARAQIPCQISSGFHIYNSALEVYFISITNSYAGNIFYVKSSDEQHFLIPVTLLFRARNQNASDTETNYPHSFRITLIIRIASTQELLIYGTNSETIIILLL